MAYYLVQAAYTPEASGRLVKAPQNRAEAIRPLVEKLGGKLDGMWLAFGDYDVIGIFQMPDNVSAVALSLAVSAGGATKAVKTTPLVTMDEGVAAMRKAGSVDYQPPR